MIDGPLAYSKPPSWPDPLSPPEPNRIAFLLEAFWYTLHSLGGLLQCEELLLVDAEAEELRAIVLEMMLALNGIKRPTHTQHLNGYLSADQRVAIEKTMVLPTLEAGAWIGQAVSLVVIYRWYAPQLSEKYRLPLPTDLEQRVWAMLCEQLPDWPKSLSTD